MPRIHSSREIRDCVYYDTHKMEPGQHLLFFDTNESIGDLNRCNLHTPGVLVLDQTVFLFSVGLRILGTTRDEEDPLLDQFIVIPTLRNKPQNELPGNVCSTLRYVNKDQAADPVDDPIAFTPGYMFKTQIIVPVRQHFSLHIYRAKRDAIVSPAPAGAFGALTVRAKLFTVVRRDVA
ncbi:hypothetical protein LCGC14_2848010 [marine sediment metagenome]|uniref:Uncharacterized protein n=1 Tax=marine sediment metagenome TaxID=412755 RepID=A0A0F9AHM6_9ZZZZ